MKDRPLLIGFAVFSVIAGIMGSFMWYFKTSVWYALKDGRSV